ncbi:hypothetical protein niasHS_001173 [Heterodera schachtii]|uniref:NR LBD domain-containing protein n=1 Tax=Heterodera schachtii TaxID=97005 RepID=A0ABD2KCG3_HETSC
MELLSKQKTKIHPLANDESTDQSYQLPANQMPSPMDLVEMPSPKNEHKIDDKKGTTDQSQSETEEPSKEDANDFSLNAFPLVKSLIGIDGAISAKTTDTFDTINQLSCVQFRVVKFFAMDRKVRAELINQYTSFRELLESRISILNNMDKFTVQIEHQWERNWDHFKCLHLFSLLDLLRSIPAFCTIDLDDQVRLANYVGSAVYLMSTNFHSNIVSFDAENEFKLSKFMNNANPCLEEFLLLRAILICHSSVSYLSQNAKSLIQSESERYACCLMHFSRLKHGNERGIIRYAEVINVAEQLLYAQSKLHSHLTVMAMVTHRDKFYEATPSPFVPMLLNGYE